MNEDQNKYYRMFVTTQTTLDENTDIWSSNVKFAENKTALDNEIALAEAAAETAGGSSAGRTRNKAQVKDALQRKLLVISGTLFAHASINDDEELKAKLKTSRSAIDKLRETDLATYAEVVLKEAQQLAETLAQDYGIPAAELTDLDTTLDEYRPLIGAPKQRQAAINAAKKTLDSHIKNANDILTDVLDKLMLRYQVTHPAFHTAYEQSRTIVD